MSTPVYPQKDIFIKRKEAGIPCKIKVPATYLKKRETGLEPVNR